MTDRAVKALDIDTRCLYFERMDTKPSFSPSKRKFLRLAELAGCSIAYSQSSVHVSKGRKSVVVFESGRIYPGDIPLHCAVGMSIKDASQFMGLTLD